MIAMNNQNKIEPEVESDGAYCYCPRCGYHRLMPVQQTHCPKCKIELDWDWFEAMKIKK